MTIPSTPNVYLRWAAFNAEIKCKMSWYIFGIRPNGAFYGEIWFRFYDCEGNQSAGWVTGVQGTLSGEDDKQLRELVTAITECGETSNFGGVDYRFCEGLLGLGPRGNLSVLFKYNVKGLVGSKGAHLFQQILSVLEPYMETFYPE